MSSTDRIPLYQKIQEYVRELINSEGLKTGDRIPTEKELMDRFNVSKITVVNALTGLANERIITRVPGRGSFVSETIPSEEESGDTHPLGLGGPVAAAASSYPAADKPEMLKSGAVKSGLIGIVMPSIDDYFAIRIIKGIEKAMDEKGYRSMILLSRSKLEKEKEAIKTLMRLGVEGMLIFPVDEERYNEEILTMKLNGFPFVLIDRYLPGVETNYIASDGRLGTSLAVDLLWNYGHREIALCSDSPLQTVTVQERTEGYIQALKEKGELINPAHIINGFDLSEMDNNESHPLYRYIRNRMATAYIALNGRLGVYIYQMAEKAGLRIPEDLSIVTFDDPTSIVEEFSIFTHIKQYEQDMGYQAANKLFGVIQGGEEGKIKFSKTLIRPELIERKTTGPIVRKL
ncbi:GntR family transcriptional regulator [Paenibacillus spongiae]|uniref:Substrate-binding domain-containing protein n=1 Tax=Paenibacillus spongiae TaxID=2909671 RepID=A0ABY5S4T9_9BACL|nr:substrate-binding domain-containing protein [Paenibacillus spongiae]UVI28911.1 substrate-binding domain-containing protein [Paenibacillus spongiae]